MTATAFPKNPYIIGRPIHEPSNFFGREEIFNFIEDNLENESQVILLFGQRRIGKTSIIKQIPQAVNLANFVFVPLSLQGKAHKSLGEVLFELATDIKDSIRDYLKTPQLDITIPSVTEFKRQSKIFVEQFLAQIYNLLESKNLVLLIDEFDALEDTKKDSAVNQFFPYLYSILPKQKQLYLIPVVGRRLDDMPTLLGLFKEAPHKQIGLLDKYDTKQLICKPTADILNYDANSIQTILDLSTGHPYFTQLICFAIFGRLRQEQRHDVTKQDVTEIIDKAIEYGEGGLAWFYDGLTKPEKLIFATIAEVQQHKNTDLWQFLKQQKINKKKPLTIAHKQLLSWEFTKQEWEYIPNSIQVDKITVELVRLWLLKRHPAGQEIKSYQTWLRDNSKLRRYLPSGVAALTLMIGGVTWWYSPWGQIQQVRWDLVYLSGRVNDSGAGDVAVAFARDQRLNQAIKIINKDIEDPQYKARALNAIAEAYRKLNQHPEASKILEQALVSANQIEDSDDKARVLNAIAEAYGNLNQNPEAITILEEALDSANQIENSDNKAEALIAIAEATGKLNQHPEAIKILEQTLISANQIEDSDYKLWVLSAISIATGNLNLDQNSEIIKILEQALVSANQIKSSKKNFGVNARALRAIAVAYAKQGKWHQARKVIDLITVEDYQADALSGVLTIWAENKNTDLTENEEQ